MRRILLKRIPRELKANFFRNFSLFLLIVFSLFIVVSIVDASERIIVSTKENQEASFLEDGQFTVFTKLTDEQFKDIEDKGVTLEAHFSFDALLEDKTTLRIFAQRKNIDLVTLDEGRMPDAIDEIVIEKRYAACNNIKLGDFVHIGDEKMTVIGIGSSVDYDAPYRKLSDVSIDSRSFGTAFVTDEGYERLLKSGVGGTQDITYAFRLNGAMTDSELKDMIKDFPFDYKKVEDPYYQELLSDTYGKKDEITDGINDLVDGVEELKDGVDELKDGTEELKDGMEELSDGAGILKVVAGRLSDGINEAYDGSIELDDGVAELKDGVDELYDGVKDLKEQSDEMLEKIFDKSPDNITAFMLKADNIRIGGAAGDVEIDRYVGMMAGVIVMVLFTYVLSVFVIHQIKSESSVIGALYSLGVRKKELLRHYISLPTIVCFLAGLTGGLLGMSSFGSDVMMADSFEYFSLPWAKPYVPNYLLVYAFVMPPVVSAIVNFLVINKNLSRTPLSLLRNEQKVPRGKNVKLGRFKFLTMYQIRQLLRETRTAVTVFFGMAISLMIFMLGMDCYVLCESAGRLNSEDVRYQYMYTYKYPSKEVPEGGEAVYIETLKKEQYGYNLDITLMGIDDDNPYFDVKTVKGKNKIVASDAITARYGVGIGDKIIFSDTANDIDYAFTIEKVVPYSVGLTAFMDIDSMRELFGEDDDHYNAVLSKHELDIDEGRLYSVTSKADIDKASGIFLDLMRGMFTVLIVASILVFCLVMYLMMSVMVDRAAFGISLLKIFGYRGKEIKKLYLDGNRMIIILGAVIGVPVAKLAMDKLFPIFVANVGCALHLEFRPIYYVMIFASIYLCYAVINLFLMRKLGKVSQAEVLKNRE